MTTFLSVVSVKKPCTHLITSTGTGEAAGIKCNRSDSLNFANICFIREVIHLGVHIGDVTSALITWALVLTLIGDQCRISSQRA